MRNPFRRRRTGWVITRPEDLTTPAFLSAWDQAIASVRDAYDHLVQTAIDANDTCDCGTPIDGPRHTMALTAVVLDNDPTVVAKLLVEAVLRDARAQIEARR